MHTSHTDNLAHVALVGRRNVGKSTLFNAICRHNYAITAENPGLTRDILDVEVEHAGCRFVLSDTPGLDLVAPNDLMAPIPKLAHKINDKINIQIIKHTRNYLLHANVIVLVMAAPRPHSFDLDFLRFIRRQARQSALLCLVNKVDDPNQAETALVPFYETQFQKLLALSARGRWHINAVLDAIQEGDLTTTAAL